MYHRGDLTPLARAYRVVDALRGYRRGRTLKALVGHVDASVRTIGRDIADLNDAGIQIDLVPFDGEPCGLKDRGYATVAVTTRERFTLLAARSMFDVFRASALHDDVLSVMAKLEQRGDTPPTSHSGECIAHIPSGGVKSYADKADVIDAFQTGTLRGRVVQYAYKDSGRRNAARAGCTAGDARVSTRAVRGRSARKRHSIVARVRGYVCSQSSGSPMRRRFETHASKCRRTSPSTNYSTVPPASMSAEDSRSSL